MNMRPFFIAAWLLFSLALSAQPAEKEALSTIRKVTVYLQGAQVSRTAAVALPAGPTALKFTGLSPMLDPESIQVSALGNFTILSVQHQINYMKENEPDAEVKKLQTEIQQLQIKTDREQAALSALEEEERFILANKTLGGEKGWTAEDLKAGADFYRSRLTELRLRKLDISLVVQKLNEDKKRFQNQINELNARQRNVATSEIVVNVSAPAAVSAEFALSYLAPNASWTPSYDVRVQDITKPLALTYKAQVVQNTGENWSNVQLTLSTGNPSLNNTRPELQAWWLRFYEPVAYYGRRERMQTMDSPATMAKESVMSRDEDKAASGPVVEQVERTTTQEFRIAQPYSIVGGTKPVTVVIAQEEVPAFYEYYCVPKLDKTAYLTAGIADWNSYRLLSGEALLFFEGSYVGKTYLNTAETGDTLRLSLGRDESIVVERKREKEFAEKQFLGGKITQTTGWNIELRNSKKQAVSIVIEDQYPLSTSEEIEVKLEQSKGAVVNPATGQLLWKLNIAPGKTEKLNFRYSVRYPGKRQLTLE